MIFIRFVCVVQLSNLSLWLRSVRFVCGKSWWQILLRGYLLLECKPVCALGLNVRTCFIVDLYSLKHECHANCVLNNETSVTKSYVDS